MFAQLHNQWYSLFMVVVYDNFFLSGKAWVASVIYHVQLIVVIM